MTEDTPKSNTYEIDPIFLPTREKIFEGDEGEETYRQLMEYIQKKEELLRDIEVLRKERDGRAEDDKRKKAKIASTGVRYSDNRLLAELVSSNSQIARLKEQVSELDRRNLRLLVQSGDTWLNILITSAGAFGLSENNRVQHPSISARLSEEITVYGTCHDAFDYYRQFDPEKSWAIQVGITPAYQLYIKYEFNTRQPSKLEHKPTILDGERSAQNNALWNLYSQIFKAVFPLPPPASI